MTDGAHLAVEIDQTVMPGWIQTCVALVGAVLLIAPTLAVVWMH